MQNPDFLRTMSEMMSRPEVVDQVSESVYVKRSIDDTSYPVLFRFSRWTLTTSKLLSPRSYSLSHTVVQPTYLIRLLDSPIFSFAYLRSGPPQIIASNPQLAGMGPQIRQMMNNPMVRQMMSNPETLRMVRGLRFFLKNLTSEALIVL